MGSPHKWDTEEEAKKFAKGFTGISQKEETTINGFYATKEYGVFSGNGIIANVVIVDRNTTYQFMSILNKLKENNIALNNNELQVILDHMANSFIKGR